MTFIKKSPTSSTLPCTSGKPTEIHCIQYLRALGAIGVVAFHISEEFAGKFYLGSAGVDLFFVISGFVMWITTANRDTTPKDFIRRRITRIVPLYWIVTFLTAVAIVWKPAFFYNAALSPLNFAGSLVFFPIVRDGALLPVVELGWTLCYEMLFYIIFAMTLRYRQSLRPIILVLILITAVSAHPLLPIGHLSAFTKPIMLEFAAGVMIGALFTSNYTMPVWCSYLLILAGFAGLYFSVPAPTDTTRVFYWGIPAIAIVSGMVWLEKEQSIPQIKLLHLLGDTSFSIYLWHALLLPVLTGVTLHVHLPKAFQPWVLFSGAISIGTLLGLLLERPLTRRFQGYRRKVSAGKTIHVTTEQEA